MNLNAQNESVVRVMASDLLVKNAEINVILTNILNLNHNPGLTVIENIPKYALFQRIIESTSTIKVKHLKLINNSLDEIKYMFNNLQVNKETENNLVFNVEILTKLYIELENKYNEIKNNFQELLNVILEYKMRIQNILAHNKLNGISNSNALEAIDQDLKLKTLINNLNPIKDKILSFQFTHLNEQKLQLLSILKDYKHYMTIELNRPLRKAA